MRGRSGTVLVAAALIVVAGMTRADEIRVLSVGAVENVIRTLAADFAKESGHRIVLTVAAPAVVMQNIKAGEVHDAIIISEPEMDALDRDGLVNPESRAPLAAAGFGVAVRAGARLPDLATVDAFKQALLNARSIVYGDPSIPNQSGEKAERLLAGAGILDVLRPKIRVVPGRAQSQEMIAKGEVELGLYDASEIPAGNGVQFAGPVPPALQVLTTYEGALMSDGSAPEAARAFIEFLASADARGKWTAARLEPLNR